MEVKIIECPRDAMQGLKGFVDTPKKIEYLNSLLKVGFHTLDCGSFVSHKLIPQMADTTKVIEKLNPEKTKLSVIVANVRGASDAASHEKITYLGFPFSVSETFQKRNANSTIKESFIAVNEILNICEKNNKKFIAYISMCFGNPYGDLWNEDIIINWISQLKKSGVRYFSLSDTAAMSNPKSIAAIINAVKNEFPKLNYGCHFHTHEHNWQEKIETAYNFGCRRFDGALKGFGGCPMASDELIGNMPTEKMFEYFENRTIKTGLKTEKLMEAMLLANEIFK